MSFFLVVQWSSKKWPPLKRLGTSWVALGPFWAAPGGHFGLPGVGHFFVIFGKRFWRLGPGPRTKQVYCCFGGVCCVRFVGVLLSLSCLPRGAPGRHANIDNSLKIALFTMNLLVCPFCAKCKENKFQSTGARKTARQTRADTAPAMCFKKTKNIDFGSPNGSKILPKSLPSRKRVGRWRPKTHPRAANRDQKDPKSEPRALQGARKRISRNKGVTRSCDGVSAELRLDRLPGRGGVGIL